MRFLFPLLVALLTIFVIAPLGYPGGFQSHTGLLAAYNLIDLDQNPHLDWTPIVGRSFDFLRGEGALPYLFALIFHSVGFAYLDSIKLVYAFAWIASGLAMFALARKLVVSGVEPFFDEASALLAAIVYVYLPYHIATVYVRGAFAEAVLWAVFPLALLAVLSPQSTVRSPPSPATRVMRFTLHASPFAALSLIQPGLAIIFAAFACSVSFTLTAIPMINWRAMNFAHAFAPPLAGILAGFALSIPTLFRYGLSISYDGFNPTYVFPFQLFSALWGYGITTGSFLDQFPFQIGVVPLGLGIIAAALGSRPQASNESKHAAMIFFGAAIVFAVLTFEIAAPVWRILGFLAAAPWQSLAFVGFALAFAAGAVVKLDERLAHFPMLAVLVSLPVVASYGYLQPRFLDAQPTRPHIAIFGKNEIALLDYRINGPLRHGATLRVQLTWQALRAPDNDYTVFMHAIHKDGGTWGEADRKPLDGELPTTKWTPGQVFFDTQTIQIDVEGPTEDYYLEFGLYNPATGKRALLPDGSDHLNLPRPGDPPPFVPTR